MYLINNGSGVIPPISDTSTRGVNIDGADFIHLHGGLTVSNFSPTQLAHYEKKVGWRISEWCPAVGIARSTYYTLEGDRAPASVKLGGMHIITEGPAEWLRRVGIERSKA